MSVIIYVECDIAADLGCRTFSKEISTNLLRFLVITVAVLSVCTSSIYVDVCIRPLCFSLCSLPVLPRAYRGSMFSLRAEELVVFVHFRHGTARHLSSTPKHVCVSAVLLFLVSGMEMEMARTAVVLRKVKVKIIFLSVAIPRVCLSYSSSGARCKR